MRFRLLLGLVVLLSAMTGEAFCEPKRVMLLHSFGRDFAPWNEYARTIREELDQQSKEPLDIFEASLATARFRDNDEGPFVDYLHALFANRKFDLVVSIGGPAVSFFQRHREDLFPSIPAVYTGVERRLVASATLTANDAVVASSIDFHRSIENILRVLPETVNVVVILGNSPIEKYWLEQLRTAFKPFGRRVVFTWFNELSFDEMLKRVAVLPPRSAIFFGLLSVDAAGVAHEEGKAMAQLHAVANSPIFSYNDVFFGEGIVGGPLLVVADVGRQVASDAVRILRGESPGAIKTPPIEFGMPKFDWRELQRWNISESRLPPGSEIYFRSPSAWDQYRWQISAGVAALLLQAAIITRLLVERRRRYFAEAEASSRRREVIRLNRVTTASVLSSSIAHELNQPLGAILSNTEAAQMLLKVHPPDLAKINDILSDIVRDEERAGEIIIGLRNLLDNRNEAELQALDLNDTVPELVKIVAPEVVRREITLHTILASEALLVRADPIHMQQVIINLVMNGMDAMSEVPRPRDLTIRTHRNAERGVAEVQVSDSGTGIPNENLRRVFDPFVTTKRQGTGLGLPIARTIIESYGGNIWAENLQRGAMFCFTLPLVRSS
jgi:signal transduction histidine kinase